MAAEAKKVVRFGLTNVHYAMLNEETGKYETPKRVLGGIQLTMEPQGDSSTTNADNGPFYTTTANSGYTGQLNIASASDEMLIDLLGYVKDSNGVVGELADSISKPFALMFEINSNIEPQRFVFYNVTIARPSNEANTTGETTEPDTPTFDFTAISKDFEVNGEVKPYVKNHVTKSTETKTTYDKWYQAVYIPGQEAA